MINKDRFKDMAAYTQQEYARMIFYYFEAGHNAAEAAREYARLNPHARLPSPPVILGAVRRFHETGNVMPNVANGGRPRHVRVPELEEAVLEIFRDNPRETSRSIGLRLGVSHWIVWRILHDNNQYPYRFIPVQALYDGDAHERLRYCRWILVQHQRNPYFIKRILFTDEARFGRCSTFNRQNEREWGDRDNRPYPYIANRRHQNLFHVNVWVGIIGDRIVCFYDHPLSHKDLERLLYYLTNASPFP